MPRKRPSVSALEDLYSTHLSKLQDRRKQVVEAGVSGPALAQRLTPEIADAKRTLGHIHACLLLLDPTWTPDRARPIKRRRKASPFRRNGLLDRAYDVLRGADQPLTTREIMDLSVRRADGFTPEQARNEKLVADLTKLLSGQQKVGAVAKFGARPIRWAIIRGRVEPESAAPGDDA